MICSHCHNEIEDGNNICPLCYGVLDNTPSAGDSRSGRKASASKRVSRGGSGSRGRRKKKKRVSAAGVLAFVMIVALLVLIGFIVRSMFMLGDEPAVKATPTPAPTQELNFVVFGATPTRTPSQQTTPTPVVAVTTPTPEAQTQTYTYTTLRKGSEGRDVITMQKALTELGYLSGACDGNFGTGTLNAVKAFQSANQLNADGIAGPQTLEKLYSMVNYTPAPNGTPEVKPGDILDLPG